MWKLWSKRTDCIRGTHWQLERDCTEDTAEEWAKVYQNDEPSVIFVLSKTKPPMGRKH